MSDSEQRKKHPHRKGLLICFMLLIIGACIFGIVKFVEYRNSERQIDGDGTTQGNHSGDKQLFRRSATTSDIVYSLDLDLSVLGEKCTITPQVDIDGLAVTLNFLDKNKKRLDSVVKQLGDVKAGAQVSFSISLFEISLSVAWNTAYGSLAVTGGTVSYFA